MVVPAERFKQQANKIKELEDQVNSHQRERVLIYDAAMKQVRCTLQEGKFERVGILAPSR